VAQICAAWAEAHQQSHHKAAANALGYLAGSLTPHELTPLHFQSLHANWKSRLTANSLYHYTRSLRRLVAWIAAIAKCPELPALIVKARQPSPRKTIASPAEIDALIAAAPRWLQTIILLAANAGLRKSDCLRVAPMHYESEKRLLTIDQKKTGEIVKIPVTERLAEILDTAPTHSPTTPFYELYRGKPITNAGLSHHWSALKKKTGVNRGLWIHDLRRTVAVSLYEVSKDLRVVEQMLGHTSLSSTIRYLEHRDPAKLRPYLDAIHKMKTEVIQ
jgi:integrase